MKVNSENPYWHLPTINKLPEFQNDLHYPRRVSICDLTLDENGEGMAGVYLTPDEKTSLAILLDDIGVHRLGVLGYPSPIKKEEIEAAKKITSLDLNIKCQTLVSTTEDINAAIEVGVWGVIIRKPCSDYYSVEKEPLEEKIDDFISLANYSRNHGLQVGMMAQDITRANISDTKALICSINDEFGLDELCITDSQGLGNTLGIYHLIKRIKSWVDAPLSVHCHNHLGMGVANACAAVAAGAEIVHTTVNGLGHHAGMPPTEEVVVALAIGYGLEIDINFQRLYELSKKVEQLTGMEMHPHKPVTGDMMFSRSEERKHIQDLIDSTKKGLLKDFFPYMPEFVGNKPKVIMGPKVTRLAVEYNLESLNIQATESQINEIYSEIRNKAKGERRIVTNQELQTIAKNVLH